MTPLALALAWLPLLSLNPLDASASLHPLHLFASLNTLDLFARCFMSNIGN